jgi:hypothetical protein
VHEARERQLRGAKAAADCLTRFDHHGGQPTLRGDNASREAVGTRTDYRNVAGRWHGG